jgi:hypothetical protein
MPVEFDTPAQVRRPVVFSIRHPETRRQRQSGSTEGPRKEAMIPQASLGDRGVWARVPRLRFGMTDLGRVIPKVRRDPKPEL